MPERASAQVNVTVTLVLFQPAPLGTGLCVSLMLGGVLSILMAADFAGSVLPALSTLQ